MYGCDQEDNTVSRTINNIGEGANEGDLGYDPVTSKEKVFQRHRDTTSQFLVQSEDIRGKSLTSKIDRSSAAGKAGRSSVEGRSDRYPSSSKVAHSTSAPKFANTTTSSKVTRSSPEEDPLWSSDSDLDDSIELHPTRHHLDVKSPPSSAASTAARDAAPVASMSVYSSTPKSTRVNNIARFAASNLRSLFSRNCPPGVGGGGVNCPPGGGGMVASPITSVNNDFADNLSDDLLSRSLMDEFNGL